MLYPFELRAREGTSQVYSTLQLNHLEPGGFATDSQSAIIECSRNGEGVHR
jgi:hypothetical protein